MTPHAPDVPDVVYVVKNSEQNEELRYSLRSLKHVPHRRVWIAGYRPSWVAKSVGYIRVPPKRTKFLSSTANLRAACEHAGVSPEFYFFHDDLVVMKPMARIPVLHRGRVADVEAVYRRKGVRSRYFRGLLQTRNLIVREGIAEDPISYELHVPLPVFKDVMLEALDLAERARLDVVHKRTLYGNMMKIGGERLRDVKVMHRGSRFRTDGAFLSTTDDTFRYGQVGAHIRRQFPEVGPYEVWRRTRQEVVYS